MKKHLLLVIAALVSFSSHVLSQQMFVFIEPNNVRCSVTSTGDLFNVPGTEIGLFEVPAGSGLETFYAANLWVGGFTTDQQLRMSAETFQNNEQAWFSGPLTTNGTASTTQEIEDAYNQVWHVTSDQVALHLAYFNALQNGNFEEEFPDGYTIPDVFINWPAHGDIALGYDFNLAPFIDFNLDMYYDPSQGDYPLFCGNECIYFIINDRGSGNNGNVGLGVEIHGMMYGFTDSQDDMLENTIFLKYKMINRSTGIYNNSVMGLWADYDLGGATDDFVGTNVQRSALVSYNADDFDEETSSSPGYQFNIPMQGVVFLGGPKTNDDLADNELPDEQYSLETNSYGPFALGYGDGNFDNERLGLSYSMYYNNSSNPINGEPVAPLHYYNYLTGTWKNGSTLMFGMNGTNTSNYFAPDVTDPLALSTGQDDQGLWNETTDGNVGGDRRIVGSTGLFTLEPGEINVLDLAFVYADSEQADDEPLADFFDNRLKEAKLYFNEFLVECSSEGIDVGLGDELIRGPRINIYPNPIEDIVNIEVGKGSGVNIVSVTDISGKQVETFKVIEGLNTVDMSDLSSGIYFLVLNDIKIKLVKN